MASVSLASGTIGNVVIPTTTAALTAAAQSALNAISARIATGAESVVTYPGFGAVAPTTQSTTLLIPTASSVAIPSGSGIDGIIDSATGAVSLVDDSPTPVSVVAGSGGLVFSRTAATAGSTMLVVAGGSNTIALGSGPATVGADGAATINALGGAASVLAGVGGQALVSVGGADTVGLWGTDTVAFGQAAAALVTAQDGSNVVVSTQTGLAAPVVTLAPGQEIVGTMAGSTASVAASLGGMMVVSAWGGRTFIDPAAANVTIFGGSGSETLFGAGDSSLPGVAAPAGGALANSGSDFVFGGQGYFHGGSGPLDLLESSTVAGAATLVGGGTVDLLFSQGAGDSLRGAAGTVIMNAAGFSQPGFTVLGAAGGDILDAGSSNAFMFGAAWGSNTVLSGSGTATVFGNHGATGQVGNVYADGGSNGSLAILDFLPGADIVSLRGDTIAKSWTVTAPQTGNTAAGGTLTAAPGTYVMLSDGTTFALVGQFLSQSQISSAFR